MDHDMLSESEIDRQRRELDGAESERRASSDRDRDEQRNVVDGTRQNLRGTSQARESLARERARDDASLGNERALTDVSRSAEREISDAELSREKDARSDAQAALEEVRGLDSARQRSLREALALIEEQMSVVDGSLTGVLATVPRGTFDGRLSADVEKIRRAAGRIRTLLEDVLDPGDCRRRDHDVGGSG